MIGEGAHLPRVTVPPLQSGLSFVAAAATVVAVASLVLVRDFEWWGYVALAVFAVAAALVVVNDLNTLRAPNRIVYPSVLLLLAVIGLAGLDTFLSAVAGAALSFGLLFFGVLVSRGAMGMGDAKFGALCGAVAGLGGAPFLLAASFLLGGVYAVVMLVAFGRRRGDVVAFTPFLVAGTLIAVAVGRSHLGT